MAEVAKPNASEVDSIRNELDALQRERRVAEMRLRDLDAKRRMTINAARPGPREGRDAGRPDRRPETERPGVNERDRPPHPWDVDRPRDHDRPHPWDSNKRQDSGRKVSVMSAVARAGDRRVEHGGSDSTRASKRGNSSRDEAGDDSEWKENKRRAVEKEEGKGEKEDGEAEQEPVRTKLGLEQYEDADEGADLPDRDEQDARDSKRSQLSSVVAVNRASDPSERRERRREGRVERTEKPKAPLAENTEVKQRNRKMFGALLGHLQKAKKEEEKILQTPTMQKRVEIEEKVEVLARESAEVLRKKLAEEMRDERRKNLEQIRSVRSKQQQALHLLAMARVESQCKSLSNYIRTTTTPEIFWKPANIETAPQAIKDLMSKTKESLEAHASTVKAKMETERTEDLEAEAAAQAQRASNHAAGIEEDEEHIAGGHEESHNDDAASKHPTSSTPQKKKEQVVEEVDEEEGNVEVEVAF